MLKQEFFGKRHEKAPETPSRHQQHPVQVHTNSRPLQQHSAIQQAINNVIPITQVSMLSLKEKLVVNQGDSLENNLGAEERRLQWALANEHAIRNNFHIPKFAFRRTTNFNPTEVPFELVYLTQGLKDSWMNATFARDAAGALVCFNLKAFKVMDYLNARDNHEQQVYSILDPFQLVTVNAATIKHYYKDHPRFEDFMAWKGHEAC